jgi:hypothetical protein
MISIFKESQKLLNSKPNDGKIAVFDFTDAGELGYHFGYTPETLQDVGVTTLELLSGSGKKDGEGSYSYFTRLFQDGEKDIMVLADPLRSDKLNSLATLDKIYNTTTVEKNFKALVVWLRQRNYKYIYILCSPVESTNLNMILRNK